MEIDATYFIKFCFQIKTMEATLLFLSKFEVNNLINMFGAIVFSFSNIYAIYKKFFYFILM